MNEEQVRSSVSRAWLLAALEEYESIRQSMPALQSLRRPHFVIDPGLRTTLGKWHRSTRRLVLAAELFISCDWELVRQVLRHELAHVMVDEVFGCWHEPPHGPAFARACAMLGIDPAARLPVPAVPGETEHRLLRRVQKLMALGESPNQHEAEAALAKAHELMLRHNVALTGQGQGQYAFRWVGPLQQRVPSWTWDIMRVLTDFYFVDYICRPLWDEMTGSWLRCLEIYGTPSNLDVAEYVYYFLLRVGPGEWDEYRRRQKLSHGRQRLSFLRGLYRGVHARLAAERRSLAEASALVWVGDPGLDNFFERRNPRVRHRRSSYLLYEGAHAAGESVGRDLRIRPGIVGGSAVPSGPRLLDG